MSGRTYEQVARAESTEGTRRAIIDAALALFDEEGLVDPPLAVVADRAGVSSRTLLRHFGSKEGLVEAAISVREAAVMASREAPSGDVATAVRRLVDHYEAMGDRVLVMLAEAERRPAVRRIADSGTRMHVRWVEEVFAPDLDGLTTRRRDERVALLATVTDVYAWALLRRRHGLSRRASQAAIRGLVDHARGADR